MRPLQTLWRSGWDSNPRVVSHKLISSYLERKSLRTRKETLVLPAPENQSHSIFLTKDCQA